MLTALSLWEMWPIGSAAVVACIFVFLGLELLKYWMGPADENEESPHAWSDTFGKRSSFGLTAIILLFVVAVVVMVVGLWWSSQ
jgi:hypothetical protein